MLRGDRGSLPSLGIPSYRQSAAAALRRFFSCQWEFNVRPHVYFQLSDWHIIGSQILVIVFMDPN